MKRIQPCYKVDKPPGLCKKRGGGAYEYIRSIDIVNSFRNVSHCAACLFG